MYETRTYFLFAVLGAIGYQWMVDRGGELPPVTENLDPEYDYVIGEGIILKEV